MNTERKLPGGQNGAATQLKNLPRADHELIWIWREEKGEKGQPTNAEIRARIATQFKIQLNHDTHLSRYWAWCKQRRNFEHANDMVEQFQEFAGKRNSHWPAEKVRAVAIEFFLAKTIKNEDEDTFAAILKLDQNERFTEMKAAQKDRQLDQQDEKIALQAAKVAQAGAVQKVTSNRKLTPQEKEAEYRRIFGLK